MKTIKKNANGFKNNFNQFQDLAIPISNQLLVKGGGDGDGSGGATGIVIEEIVVQ